MPRSLYAWYSWNELEALGQRNAQLDGEIDLERLARLRELLHSDDGSVRASFRFGQQGAGYVTVELRYEITLELACQRCLEPMRENAAQSVSFVFIEDESTEAGAPEGYEPVPLSGDRFQPATLIEDELIVSLPLIPRHARLDECGALATELDGLNREVESSPPLRNH